MVLSPATALLLALAVPAGQVADTVHYASFEAAWRLVRDTHFDTTFNGVNWVALGDSIRPRAVGASRDSVRGLIRSMLSRLGQSHFSLIAEEDADRPARAGGEATPGLDVRLVGEHVLVTTVDPGSPADRAGIRPGWRLAAIDTSMVDTMLHRVRTQQSRYGPGLMVWGLVRARLSGAVGTPLTLTLYDGADREVRHALVREADRSLRVKFGDLPAFQARFAARSVTRGNVRAGVIWFNYWMVPLLRQVDSAVDAERGADGMVIDLRGNQGGIVAMVNGVGGHFTPRPDTLGFFATRTANLVIVTNPRSVAPDGRRVQPFAGPVALLLDELSGSASEVFAGGMQAIGRVRVFGTTSLGGVLPAVWDRLPNGDVLYHAIGDFRTVDGVLLEGRGVEPDEPVNLTREDLLAGRDPVLEAALDWIARYPPGRTEGARP